MGRKFTQQEFVLGLIEETLEAAERQAEADIPEPESGVGPCEAGLEGGSLQPQEEDTPTVAGAEEAVQCQPAQQPNSK